MRFLTLLLCLACSKGDSSPHLYGSGAERSLLEKEAVVLDEVLVDAERSGPVVVQGEIGQVCDLGCWFYLLGQRGVLYVKMDLDSGLVIPGSSVKKRAIVRGVLQSEGESKTSQGRRLLAEQVLIY